MDRHLTVLGIIYLCFSALNVFAALIVFAAVAGGGLLSGNPHAIFITSTVASVIASVLLISAIPGVIGGVGILKHRTWARYLLIVLAILNLVHFPVGTAIGIYTLWVLTKPETVALLERRPAGASSRVS